jgi:long-chain acyl-CoA synthetase
MVKLFFACFKAGLIAVPLNVRMKAPEIAYVLAHSKAAMCFAHPDLAAVINKAAQECASLRRIEVALPSLHEEIRETTLPQVDGDAPALILYTSGTTARPKGVTHTHRTLHVGVRLVCLAAPDDLQTVLVMTQMAFISAISAGCLLAIATAATCVLVPTFDAPLVLDTIERFQCSYTFGLPSMVQFLIEEQTRNPRNIVSLRTFIAGGDSIPVNTQERFLSLFGIPVREGHGMTEIGPSIGNPADAIRPGSLGKPIGDVQVRIVDANGREVLDGQIGEITVRTRAAFVGYWDDPAATKEALRNGWVYSGDLGRRDVQGYFWFEGRKKEIIVRGGFNISPQEVEEAIYAHPAVLEVAVIGMPDPLPVHGERVVAFVTLRDGLITDERELREHAAQHLADIKVPEKILFLKSLPKGVTGKVQRRALKEISAAA